MVIKVIHDGHAYAIEAPDGCEVSRHGHKPPVMGESLDDVLRVPTSKGIMRLPTPLVIHSATKGLYGLRIVQGPDPVA
jgi:hypothetical protein